jgi:hypothetical protein
MNRWYPGHYKAAGSQENALIKAGKVKLGHLSINCTNGAACYVKLYDLAVAPASTDTPKQIYWIAATTGLREIVLPNDGLQFENGLGIRIVTEQADNGTTGVSANAVNVNYALG